MSETTDPVRGMQKVLDAAARVTAGDWKASRDVRAQADAIILDDNLSKTPEYLPVCKLYVEIAETITERLGGNPGRGEIWAKLHPDET
jgi:hypothetical protein